MHGIAEETARMPNTLVLPMTERTTLPLSLHRKLIFDAGGHLVLPPHETVASAFDKARTLRLAQSLGITVPKTVLLDHPDRAQEIQQNLTYPLVIKPRSSEQVSASGGVTASGTPKYARNRRDFLDACNRMSRRCTEILVQEYIEGTGAGYFALMNNGELRAEFAHRRLRDVRPTGSGSCLRISVKPDPEVRRQSLAILRALKWHGVAMVEFRLRPDGSPVLMEINGRFWNSLALAVHAGVDFPTLLARMVQEDSMTTLPTYSEGVRCRWLLGDFRHLLEVWRGAPAGYVGHFPSRWRTLAAFVTPVPKTFHDNFQMRDPLPALGDWIYFWMVRVPTMFRDRPTRLRGHRAERRYSHS